MTRDQTASEPTLQSAAAPSPFPPIADYAFLSNCHTGALVAPDGAVEWLCVPAFDAPSVFGSLLDRQAGFFRLGPFGIAHPSDRSYEPGTNVLVTSWKTPTGWIVVRDALTMGPREGEDTITPHTRPPADDDGDHMLVRTVECIEGQVEIELVCEPAFDYGRAQAEWSLVGDDRHAADATGAGQTIRLRSDLALGIEGNRVRGRHTLRLGDRAYCALSWAEELAAPANVDEADSRMAATTTFWRAWLGRARIPDHRFRDPIQRSALAIKGLTYMPTGATVAALTTSLPETPGGERNWDYRYSWFRDSMLVLNALYSLGFDWEANDFYWFIADIAERDAEQLQIMYGVDGERDLTEQHLDHLNGYGGARPVRTGNGAYDQRQHDMWGSVVASIYLHVRSRSQGRLDERAWAIVRQMVDAALANWRKPDQGVWEVRGEPQHFTSSKVMCWLAVHTGAKLARIRDEDSGLADKWQAAAEEIKTDICDHAVSERGVFRQHYKTDALDASLLVIPLLGFLPPDDPRVRATVLAIADELSVDDLVLRYKVEETDDGLSGEEGTFTICSFTMVAALSAIGEHQRARQLCEKLLKLASPLGLYAEELEPSTGRHLGNFPQAFTHLALISAVMAVIRAERSPS
jgi:alpha,alpha-trehalase